MIRVFAVVLIAIFGSITVEPFLAALLPAGPILPLVAVLLLAVSGGPFHGVIAGTLAGFLVDLLGTDAIGIHLGAMAALGFIIGKSARFLPVWPFGLKAAASGVLLVLYLPLTAIFVRLSGSVPQLDPGAILIFTAVNLLCAVVIAFIPGISFLQRSEA